MRSQADARYLQPWARWQLRRSRGLLALTIILVIGALFSTLRHLRRAGFFSHVFGLRDPLWLYSHIDAAATSFPPKDPVYVVFQPPPPPSRGPPSETLERVHEFPAECIDTFFATGKLCRTGPDPLLDVVWTWVNGSDRLLQDSMMKTAKNTGFPLPMTSHPKSQFFRDHDELRHSVRSVLKHFSVHTSQLHILTSDFPLSLVGGDKMYNETRRLGLAPRWLDLDRMGEWRDGHVHLDMRYHTEVFRAYNGSNFNSYGIESQLMNMQGISENFVYMNDDFFMTTDLSAADFYTSTYGTVLRMQADLLVNGNQEPHASTGGEWGPLEYTNWLLNNRFGARRRPYATHAAKSLSTSLMKEMARVWHAELAVTASHPFRGMKKGHRDVYSMFLFSHFIVERWREGLLWSWVVGKLGGLDGRWGPAEMAKAWQDLGGLPGEGELRIVTTKRTTLDKVYENFQAAGHVASGKTKYVFTSGDGYPYDHRNPEGTQTWPSFESPGDYICKISYETCFEQAGSTIAADFFKYITFQNNRRCGDCIIHALRAASGSGGLAAFLPDGSRDYAAEPSQRRQAEVLADDPPHLPLVSDWRDGDYSLSSVIAAQGEVNVRMWTLRMLERYRFVIGQTPTAFHQITSSTAARIKLKKVDEDTDVALLCLNDNIQGLTREADRLLLAWQEKKWGHKAEWER